MTVRKGVSNVLAGKKIGIGTTLMGAFTIGSGISDYKQARLEGKGKVGAATSAIGNAIVFEAMGGWALAAEAAGALPNLAMNGYLKATSAARSMDRAARNAPFANATFADSQQAYTMRQAGMQLAQASKYNLQQTLMGNEASMMHRL